MSGPVRLTVNGATREVTPRKGLTLLRYLRTELGLTGTRQGCESGACGACTVVVDGVAVQSCQLSVAAAEGANVETIEALAASPDGAALVQALTDKGAAQCGYCLPGIIASALAARRLDQGADAAAMLARNICRCGTQHRILAALRGGEDE